MKKHLQRALWTLAGILSLGWAQAQTVTGTVTDATGPLPGANVIVKGTTNGTTTDFDGNYVIDNVGSNAILVFSYIGYENKEIAVNGKAVVNATLAEAASQLDEVILIGYGQTTARDATGAVASVKAEDFNRGLIASPEELIQGKTAGVQITQTSGEPGAGITIRIRGTSSVRGNNDPLFVVDGVPLTNEDSSSGAIDLGRGTSAAQNPLNFLNPSDIASIDILKDASATAIYGSRGANGVVIITTKSGKGNRGGILDFSAGVSISEVAKTFDVLSSEEFLANLSRYGAIASEQDFGASTDWQDEIFRTAISQQYNASYADASDEGDYRISLGYADQEGIVENSGLERITGRFNGNYKLFDDKLLLSLNLTYSNTENLQVLNSDNVGFEGDLFASAYIGNPTWPSSADIQLNNTNANPNSLLKYYQAITETDRFLANFSASYDLTDDFNAKVNFGYDDSSSERREAYSPELFLSNGVFGNGRAAIADVNRDSYLFEFLLNYNKDFENSKISALLGYSYQEFNNYSRTNQGFGFSSSDFGSIYSDLRSSYRELRGLIGGSYQQFGFDSDRFFVNRLFPAVGTEDLTRPSGIAVGTVTEDFSNFTDELQSFFGRFNYGYRDRYLFTFTLRADGSTKFGENNQYGWFPSGAFAWILSEENFIPDFFSNLKLRAGYGITGNQEIPHNLHQERVRFSGISIDQGGNTNPPGTNNVAFNNPDLKWEETSQINLGLDYGFFDGRLYGSFDWYRKNTTDLLIQVVSAQPAPQPFTWTNLDADVINEGFEINFNVDLLRSEDWDLGIGFNATHNTNNVENFEGSLDTGVINGQGLTGAFAQRIANNQPLNAYFLREFIGFDENGISVYEGGDVQKFVGKNPFPAWVTGFNLQFRYRNFDMSAFFAGQHDFYIYNNTANALFTAGSYGNGRNVTRDVLTSGESNLNAADVSTRFLEDGSFWRLQNLTVGYNFKFNEEDNLFRGLRIYAAGQNLFVITDYSGLDPEVNTNKAINDIPSVGIDYLSYPRPRVVTIGLNASF